MRPSRSCAAASVPATVTLDFNQNPWNYSVRQSTDKDAWGGTQVAPKGTEDYFNLDGKKVVVK